MRRLSQDSTLRVLYYGNRQSGCTIGISTYCHLTKRDIALRGRALGVDYSLTYSCYKGGEKHCGRCGTCTERKEALEGFDPTEYEA